MHSVYPMVRAFQRPTPPFLRNARFLLIHRETLPICHLQKTPRGRVQGWFPGLGHLSRDLSLTHTISI